MGGRYATDTWYRDEEIPETYIRVKPVDGSSETIFQFECDEEGCIFEYYLETTAGVLVRDWTRTTGTIDFITWLPGGTYVLRARAIDPAGNIDLVYDEGR